MTIHVPRERDLPAGHLDARKAHLMKELNRTTQRRRLSGSTRWLAAIGGSAVVVGGGVGIAAAAGVFDGGGAAVSTSIACADKPDVQHADLAVINSTDADPTHACAALWVTGVVVHGVHTAPPLVSCLMANGPLVVVPGSAGTCQQYGLQPARAATPEQARTAIAVRAVRDQLVKEIASSCHSEEQAAAAAKASLAKNGLVQWTVTTTPFGPSDKCAVFAIDQAHQLVAVSGQPGI